MAEGSNPSAHPKAVRRSGASPIGSQARGEARDDSDLDILVVLDRLPSYGAEIERTSELISRLCLESGYSISRVFVSQSAWLSEASAFLENVREEAIAS